MRSFVSIILLALIFGNVAAQKTDSVSSKKVAPWFVERFKVSAGSFIPVNNTAIQLGLNGNTGTKVDFESDLGFAKDIGTILGNVQWRTTRRSRISFSYYRIDRGSTHTIDKDITFRDQTYNVNATIRAHFNTSIYQFSYGYAILAKPRYEAGVMIGTHLVGGNAGMSLVTPGGSLSNSTSYGFVAPLPDLGIWGGYAFSDRFAANLEAAYLSVTFGDISGRILSYNLNLTYRLISKVDLSLGYTGLNFDVKAKGSKGYGELTWGYNGPAITATYSFGKKYWTH